MTEAVSEGTTPQYNPGPESNQGAEEVIGEEDSEYGTDEGDDRYNNGGTAPLKPLAVKQEDDEEEDEEEEEDEDEEEEEEEEEDLKKAHKTVKKVFRCSLCDFFSFKRESTEQHIKIHNEPQNTKLYYCSTCKYSTRVKPYFDKHKKLHSNTIVRPFKCSYCPYQGRFRSHTRAHEMRHHTGEKPFVCSLCDRGFVEQHILARHMRTAHTDERPYICDVCSRSYKQLNALRVHQRKHFEDAYICEFCEKRFSTIHQLQRHHESHQDKNMACPIHGCSFRTINQERVDNHIKNFHKKRSCGICDFTTNIQKEFIKHRNTHHAKKKVIQSFKCQHCPKSFRSSYNLKKHMVVHTGMREFQCSKCPYNTQKKGILVKHLELHELIESKPELMVNFTKCDKCDFICETSKVLGVHKRIHNTINTEKGPGEGDPEEVMTCQLCLTSLHSRDEYVDHLLFEHSNYKTHKCHHCSFTSTAQSEISLHLDLHEIQSNGSADVHCCPTCGYLTVDPTFLHQHTAKCRPKPALVPGSESVKEEEENGGVEKRRAGNIHTEIKPYKCPLCASRVQTPSSLKNHMVAHVKECKKRKAHYTHSCSGEDEVMEEGEMEEGEMEEDSSMGEDEENGEEGAPGEHTLFCGQCEYYTEREEELEAHQKLHEIQQPRFHGMLGEEVMEGEEEEEEREEEGELSPTRDEVMEGNTEQ